MRILILGGDGMLGHRLLRHLRERHEVRVTLRRDQEAYVRYGLFDLATSYAGVDVRSLERLLEVLADFKPDAVVNAVGIVKQRASAHEVIPSLEINALLPHRLALACRAAGARLLHVSTDCVFTGTRGNYSEEDAADAADLYGRSKLLGEVYESSCITLRTSIIGPELSRNTGLLEWFLAQRGEIRGFTRAIFSGFTTGEFSRVIERVLVDYPEASGLYHVSSDPISKYELLRQIGEELNHPVHIVPDESFHCDRSLDSSLFRARFHYSPPTWPEMVRELGYELARSNDF